ncbi:MAG: glutamate--tRNA ligase [Alphaproteobacteria bacterium]
MTVITRFAPSPTGYLHIGSARTALFNWLYARHNQGKFLLRIEDTDRLRSTEPAVAAIFESLSWLGLDWDEEPVFQSQRADRHADVAKQLLAEGKAYYCYCSPEELEAMREHARLNNLAPRYNGRWRDSQDVPPAGVDPVIRFKAPKTGETLINDLVQGPVRLDNAQLDDMVLLRADGTPTYMLSVVVDDHDMKVTHIIRGDDHLTNAFRQYHLYEACGWGMPLFSHIPLIHGPDGAKLSKRHGAIGASAYRDLGYLPEAMRNYLLRLGWGHGDDEIISTAEAIEWFGLDHVGRSPARFDFAKLNHLNAHYLRQTDDATLVELMLPFLGTNNVTEEDKRRLNAGMLGLKQRAHTFVELVANARFYITPPDYGHLEDEKARGCMTPENKAIIEAVAASLQQLDTLSTETVEATLRQTAETIGVKLGALAQPLRVAITGSTISPSLFEIIAIFGKQETQQRLQGFISACAG